MVDDKIKMMATEQQFKKARRLANPLERLVMCGDLLKGGRVYSVDGVKEFFDFPRYRVVAIHMNGNTMFMETLNRAGEIIGFSKMDIDCDQWEPWNT